jgi:thiol-disulfide isomerase/thioredoxin
MQHYDVVVVNFYAPWCPWCQRLAPVWEAVTDSVHQRYSEEDLRLRFAKVDCTVQVDLCRKNQITAFPSIRIFHHGSDDVVVSQ